jgi:hypothetical protein
MKRSSRAPGSVGTTNPKPDALRGKDDRVACAEDDVALTYQFAQRITEGVLLLARHGKVVGQRALVPRSIVGGFDTLEDLGL